MSAEKPQKPLPEMRVTVHVGVTGHRLAVIKDKGDPEALQGIITAILSYIQEKTAGQYGENPRFRVISSLAEGADRMVAHAGLDLGCELQCPLPMAVEDYKRTFESTEESDADDFEALLKAADSKFVIECHNSESSQSYADASRVMLNHSDFLIAVWDGKKTKSIAGTYATIRDARRAHIPIIHIPIDATDESQVVVYTDSEGRRDWRSAVAERLRDILEAPKNWRGILDGYAPKNTKFWCFDKLLEDWLLRGCKFWLAKDTAQRGAPSGGKRDYGQACKYSEQVWEEAKGYFSDSSRYYSAMYRSHVLLRYICPVLAVFALVFATYGDVYKIPALVGRCFGRDWSGFLPVASFWVSYSSIAGYSINGATSHRMDQYFRMLAKNVDFLLANAGEASTEDRKVRFSGALSYTDILDLCENIDAACMEEVSDWESSTSKRCLTYI